MWPNRCPKPGAWEAKYLQQPLALSWPNNGKRKSFSLRNKNFFVGIGGDMELRWQQLDGEGVELGSGVIAVPKVAPRASISIPCCARVGGACFLNAQAVLTADVLWAKKGHELCKFQLDFSKEGEAAEIPPAQPTTGAPPSVTSTTEALEVSGADFLIRFSKLSGVMDRYEVGGVALLEGGDAGPRHCFYRAVTDNDIGGIDPSVLPNWFVQQRVAACKCVCLLLAACGCPRLNVS
jgi:beta-galactosidase/beta-glucuronidase